MEIQIHEKLPIFFQFRKNIIRTLMSMHLSGATFIRVATPDN